MGSHNKIAELDPDEAIEIFLTRSRKDRYQQDDFMLTNAHHSLRLSDGTFKISAQSIALLRFRFEHILSILRLPSPHKADIIKDSVIYAETLEWLKTIFVKVPDNLWVRADRYDVTVDSMLLCEMCEDPVVVGIMVKYGKGVVSLDRKLESVLDASLDSEILESLSKEFTATMRTNILNPGVDTARQCLQDNVEVTADIVDMIKTIYKSDLADVCYKFFQLEDIISDNPCWIIRKYFECTIKGVLCYSKKDRLSKLDKYIAAASLDFVSFVDSILDIDKGSSENLLYHLAHLRITQINTMNSTEEEVNDLAKVLVKLNSLVQSKGKNKLSYYGN